MLNPTQDGVKTTILVVDDEAPIRANLRRVLELEGFAVIEAENGAVGLAFARRNVARLILCDVMMPQLDGFEMLAHLRGDLEWQEVPFIFLSAAADRETLRRGLALGAHDYLTKPFVLADVLALVRQRLAGADGQTQPLV